MVRARRRRAKAVDPYYFDEAVANAAVEFFPRFLCLVDAEWAGKPFTLQPWQARIVSDIFGWRRKDDGRRRYRFVRLWMPRKNGKGLALDTPLPTPSGWVAMGQVRVGDVLYDERGEECRVTFVSETHHLDCYEITFSNGEVIVCDGDHRWLTSARVDSPGVRNGPKSRKGETYTRRVRDTRELARTVTFGGRGDRNHSIDMPRPISGRAAVLPLDPYVLGLWLGDGSSHYAALNIGASDRDELVAYVAAAGVPVWLSKPKSGSGWMAHLTDRRAGRAVPFQTELRRLGVLGAGAKRIPPVYLRASAEQRIALLQGLMDSDGYVAPHGKVIEVVTTLPALGDDIAELLAGLGLKFSRRVVSLRCNGKSVDGEGHRFQFCVGRADFSVFRLKRKVARQRETVSRARTVQIESIRSVPTVPTRCIQVDSPSRLFRCGRTMIPTHNTELAAGLAHLLTIGDGEPGAQVYSHALDGAQSALCFDKASRMIALSPTLSELYEAPTQKGIFCPALLSSFKPLSGEAYGKHGLSPHANIGDEAHAWKNGKLHTFLIQGMGARRQPIDITISTAGEIKTYGHELYEASKAIFLDPSVDPETYVAIYEADPDDDWTDPAIWAKANPNLGVSLKREFLESECKRALQTPRLENDFKRYHLNIWVEQATRWLPMRDWGKNTERPDDRDYWKKLPALMKGRKCFSGIDLGSTRDLSAKVDVFPPDNPDGRYVLIPRFWMPSDNVADRDKPAHPYARWAADEFLLDGERRAAIETTPGNVTDYDFIIEAVIRDCALFNVQKVGIDILFQAMQVAVKLQEYGVPVETMRQGHLTLGAPTKELERLFLAGQLEHGNHPVLEWMFRNAVVITDSNGNIKPDKKRASEKIDGVIGAVEAFGLIHKANEPDIGAALNKAILEREGFV